MEDPTSVPPPPPPPPPSSKALGKRPISSLEEPQPTPSVVVPAVQQTLKREKRITRSSLPNNNNNNNGYGSIDEGGLIQGFEKDSQEDSGSGLIMYLPLKTPFLLTTRLLPRLNHYPPINSSSTSTSQQVQQQEPSTIRKVEEKPLYRLMEESEFLPSRLSRHQQTTQPQDPSKDKDVTNDSLYQRLHRYPEVLEKRASRLERERLIHERSKLILELEELRGRGWVYTTNSNGNSSSTSANVANNSNLAEEERKKKLRLGEERLKRYDSLLPNQPRKSNFLSSSNSLNGPATSTTAKSASPVPTTIRPISNLKPSQIPSNIKSSSPTSRSRSTRSKNSTIPTPLSATFSPSTLTTTTTGGSGPGNVAPGDASTKIKIKFNPPPPPITQSKPSTRRGRTSSGGIDPKHPNPEKDSNFYASGRTIKESKKITSISKAGEGGSNRRLSSRNSSKLNKVSYVDQSSDDLDDDNEPEEEEEEEVEEVVGGGTDSSLSDLGGDQEDSKLRNKTTTTTMRRKPRRSSTTTTSLVAAPPPLSQSTTKPRKPRRLRLKNSFFHSPSQRDAFFPSLGPPPPTTASSSSRRSSNRIQFAFGQRLPPDSILLKKFEFEPHGGGYYSSTSYASSSSHSSDSSSSSETDSEKEEKKRLKLSRGFDSKDGKRLPPKGYSRKPLERMVKDRLEQRGEGDGYVIFAGRILPRSAIFTTEGEGDRNSSNNIREQEEEVKVEKDRVKLEKGSDNLLTSTASSSSTSHPSISQVKSDSSTLRSSLSKPTVPSTSSLPRASSSSATTSSKTVVTGSGSSPSGGGGGGNGFGFALPSVTQVLFASVPKVQSTEPEEEEEEGGVGEDEMDVDL